MSTFFAKDMTKEMTKFKDFTIEKKKMARILYEFCQEYLSYPDITESNELINGMCAGLFKICFAMEGQGDFMKYLHNNALSVQEIGEQFIEEVSNKVNNQIFLGEDLGKVETFIDDWSIKISCEILVPGSHCKFFCLQ